MRGTQAELDTERVRADQAEGAAADLQREVANANSTMEEQQGLLEKVGQAGLATGAVSWTAAQGTRAPSGSQLGLCHEKQLVMHVRLWACNWGCVLDCISGHRYVSGGLWA